MTLYLLLILFLLILIESCMREANRSMKQIEESLLLIIRNEEDLLE